MSGHRVKQLPIFRIGWREALTFMREKGFTLSVHPGGNSELISPKDHIPNEGCCAYYYLTRRSTELLQAALKDSKGA